MAQIDPRGSFRSHPEVEPAVESVNRHARAVNDPRDLDALVDRLADADCVLLGEASHGTSEYYRWRAQITAKLLRDHGFSFVAVEGDWTSCYELNRYVKDLPDSHDGAREALEAFDRWPTWMWANWEMAGFFQWLRTHNDGLPEDEQAGFYGLDVYGLYESLQAVVDYLEDVDPDAAANAREAYRCFEPYGEDAQRYARSLRLVPESCQEEVVAVLEELRRNAPEYAGMAGDDAFSAEQNALVARNAEAYYRAMVDGNEDSWNVRDRHMTRTLNRLLDQHGPNASGIVWAHNTHVGDARATDMPRHGRVNVGQLAREQDTIGDVEIVGFGSTVGEVIASDAWGADMRTMDVPRAETNSYEDVFRRADPENALLFSDDVPDGDPLENARGHRAIGVVYHPQHESGNYVPTVLPDRYDAVVHIDETTALHPVELHPERERVPELYPSGL
ncbi:erythromycin esterase family protein [Halopenitus persicus]|uniref:Erythromycin esterase homolog n=1 Tax=Halopenitus persicus TaxID=1048396 RepID=A0A1H3KLS3_9EURY|nr:erythromycin esterase family protein [Halopenitus persicus]QHS17854.1 erythromycin esterase family protein [haloarchaeon 3A1-DGR]SDY53000.1 Erythromycin esterase homolog [Halopenitus persicus]